MINNYEHVNTLTGIIKNYRLQKVLAKFSSIIIDFIIFFFTGILVFSLLTLISSYFGSYFFQHPAFPVVFTLILILIKYYKEFPGLFVKKHLTYYAKEIEKQYPLNGRFISSIDFIENDYSHDKDLETGYIINTAKKINKEKIPHAKIPGIFMKIKLLTGVFLLSVVCFIFIKSNPYTYLRDTFFYKPVVIKYTFHYRDLIQKGKNFELRIQSDAKYVSLMIGPSPEKLENVQLEKNYSSSKEKISWIFTKKNITSDFYFKAVFVRQREELTHKPKLVRVFTYPSIRNIVLKYFPPARYGAKTEVFKDSGNINGFPGSLVHLSVNFTNGLKSAQVIFKSGMLIKPKIRGRNLSFSFIIRNHDEYYIRVKDIYSHANISPPVYRIIPVIDKPPVLKIIYPNKDIVSRNTDYLELRIHAEDDHGLRNIKVNLEKFTDLKAKAPLFKKVFTKRFNKDLQINKTYKISLLDLTLNPGELLKYRVSITDTGGKVVSSRWFNVRFPSLFEKLKRMEKDRENIVRNMTNLLNKQSRIQKDLKELKSKIERGTSTSEDIKKFEKLIKEQKQVFGEMNRESKKIESLRNQAARDPEVMNRALAKKLDEINKLLKEVLSKKAREALKRMQEYLKKLKNNTGVQQFKSAQDTEKYIQRLKRTIQMLKKLKYFQRLIASQTILKRMKRKAEKIRNITRRIKKQSSGTVDEVKKQRKNARELETLRKKLSQMVSKIHLREIKSNLNNVKKSLDTTVKKNIANINNSNKALNNSQSLNQNLNRIIKEFKKMIKRYSRTNIGAAITFIKRFILEMINISDRVNQIYNKSKKARSALVNYKFLMKDWVSQFQFLQSKIRKRTNKFSDVFEGILKQKRAYINYLNKLSNSLGNLAGKFSQKYISSGTIYLINQYYQLHNYFIVMLLKLQNALNNARSQQGMGNSQAQNLNSLAEMQRRLNESVKRMWGKANKGKLSKVEQQYLQKLAKRQAEISRRVQKILKQGGAVSKRLKNALEAVRKEMLEVAKLLQKRRLDEKTIKKQRKILKRMLNADIGLESKEQSKKRKGETVEEQGFTQDDEVKKIFKKYLDKQKVLTERDFRNLPSYYRELIKEYFKEMKKALIE